MNFMKLINMSFYPDYINFSVYVADILVSVIFLGVINTTSVLIQIRDIFIN
jgi:hypothetical protein